MSPPEIDSKTWGLEIAPVSVDSFRDFARRFADSPEVGPIATSLDRDARSSPDAQYFVFGLFGCGKLCAVACCEFHLSKIADSGGVLKLDSIIVDPDLRRRGLAGLLATRIFRDLVADSDVDVMRIYAHSVHPATVQMLRGLAFSEPPPTGAPISHLSIEDEGREAFVRSCDERIRDQMAQKRLQCEFCRTKSRRARPWCLPRGG